MAIVRNRRALITGVMPFDADERGRLHLVDLEYTDGVGADSDQILWEVEQGKEVLEPSALPRVQTAPPMDPREFDAMVRASRWSALTPSLPFSGLSEDRPPLAAPLFGVVNPVYLATALQHSPLRASVMRLDLPFINQSTILDFPLPLPPLPVQHKFAELRARVLRSQSRLQAGHEGGEALFSSLVQRAFSGQLGGAARSC